MIEKLVVELRCHYLKFFNVRDKRTCFGDQTGDVIPCSFDFNNGMKELGVSIPQIQP